MPKPISHKSTKQPPKFSAELSGVPGPRVYHSFDLFSGPLKFGQIIFVIGADERDFISLLRKAGVEVRVG